MCYSHYVKGVRNGAISIAQWGLLSDCYKGPFKYYVIMFLTFLGPPTHLFDDLQYFKSSKIAIF
jgi:hypothetical protein